MSKVIDLVMRLQDGVTSVLSGINARMQDTAVAANGAGRRVQKIGEGISGIGDKLVPVSAAIVGAGAAAVHAFVGFDSAVTSAGAKAGATAEEIEQLREVAKGLGNDFPISATEAAVAMDGLAASGMNANQIMGTLPSIVEASVASGESLEVTSNVVAGALNTWGLMTGNVAENSQRMADVIQMAANKSKLGMADFGVAMQYAGAPAAALGIQVEELATSMAIMSNNNIEASTSGRSLRMMLSRLVDPPKEASEALAKLGVNAIDSSGKFVGLGNVYDQLRSKMQGLTEAEKFKLAGDIAGTESASALLAVLNTSTEEYNELREAMDNASGSSKKQADLMKKTLLGTFKDLASKVEALGIAFAEVLQPKIKSVANSLGALATWFKELSPAAKNMIVNIGLSVVGFTALTKVLGPAITGVGTLMRLYGDIGKVLAGSPIQNKLLEVSVKGISKAFSMLGGVTGKVIPFIARLIPMAFTGPVGLAIAAIALIGIAIWKNWDKVKPVLQMIGNGFMKLVGIVIAVGQRIWANISPIVTKLAATFQKGIARIMAVFQRLYKAFSPILDVVFYVVGAIAAVFIGGPIAAALGGLITGFTVAIAVIEGLLTGWLTAITGIVDGVTQIFSGIIDFIVGVFTGNWEQAWSGIVQIFSGIVTGITGIFDGVIQGVRAAINSLITSINGISFTTPDWIPGIGGKSFGPLNIPLLYSGTDNWGGGPAMVHDRGAEIINLPSGSQVIPHDRSLRAAYDQGKRSSNGNGLNLTIQNLNVRNDGKSVEELAKEIMEHIHYEMSIRSINKMEGAV